jgi:hypothetical protein
MIIESYYMRNEINQRSGVHIAIEQNKKTPSIVSKGISARPGTETNIGLQKSRILRLPEPYKSNCTNKYHDERIINMIRTESAYSSKICKGLCFAATFWEACGCMHPSLVEGFLIEVWFEKISGQIKACNVTLGSDDLTCIIRLGHESIRDSNICSCGSECAEDRYRVKRFSNFDCQWKSFSFIYCNIIV